jgi:hypothetical protein
VFETERRGPFTPDAVNRPTKRIAKRAGFTFPIHRQTYALANEGHDTRHSGLAWPPVNPIHSPPRAFAISGAKVMRLRKEAGTVPVHPGARSRKVLGGAPEFADTAPDPCRRAHAFGEMAANL